MKLDKISSSGKIVIVAGGTGMFPFIDFIDLLFKKVLCE
jgi:tRNA A37 N6-isopentenylltransferase MiaA